MAIRVKSQMVAKDGNSGESPLSLVVKVHFSSGKSPPPKNGVKTEGSMTNRGEGRSERPENDSYSNKHFLFTNKNISQHDKRNYD